MEAEHNRIRRIRNQGKQIKLCRQYRCLSLSELSKGVKGLTANKLSQFEKGLEDLTEEQKTTIMQKLDWPLSFLDKTAYNIEIIK